jgi:predicted lipoprotein with Yx(FWY)xxD motif
LTSIGANPAFRRRWIARAATAALVAGSVTGLTAGLTAAQAAPTAAHKLKVVKIVTRKPFGKMLATTKGKGASLYYMPKGKCGSGCLTFWPPLLLPKGSKATPTGVACLGTVKFGKRTQITYRGKRLYTFTSDSGTSVTGNGIAGFVVAKVKTGKCPKK